MADLGALKNLDAGKVKLGKVTFTFSKMPALEGWRVLDKIRNAMAETQIDPDQNEALTILRAILALDSAFVEQLRVDMFVWIEFSSPQTTPQTLLGAEDMAFAELEPSDVYEVLLRSLAVNFTASFRSLRSRLGLDAEQNTPPSKP